MQPVLMYSTAYCPFCVRAKQLLKSKGVAFEDVAVDRDQKLRQEMMQKSGQHTVPQIWVGDYHVGGCDELFDLERKGELDRLLTG